MLKCAFYEKEITPPIGDGMPGYFDKNRICKGVLDRLYAKAVVFDDGHDCVVMLVIDAVTIPDEYCAQLKKEIEKNTGIPGDRVAVCATHSHYGIPCGESFGVEADEEFMKVLCRLASDCVVLAIEKLQPCRIRFASGHLYDTSFNRDYVLDDGRIMTNPAPEFRDRIVRHYAGIDPNLPAILIENEEGEKIGAVYSFACHQDTVKNPFYTGDYSSVVSKDLKTEYGQEFVAIYLAGASGDLTHRDFIAMTRDENYKVPDYHTIGHRIAAELLRAVRQDSELIQAEEIHSAHEKVTCRYRRATKEEIERAKAVVSGKIEDKNQMLGAIHSQLLLQYEAKMKDMNQEYGYLEIQVFAIGSVLLYVMPGELYHQFGIELRAGSPQGQVIIATNCNGTGGYIPVPELFGTSVYPVQLCDESKWVPETGALLTKRALALSKELQ